MRSGRRRSRARRRGPRWSEPAVAEGRQGVDGLAGRNRQVDGNDLAGRRPGQQLLARLARRRAGRCRARRDRLNVTRLDVLLELDQRPALAEGERGSPAAPRGCCPWPGRPTSNHVAPRTATIRMRAPAATGLGRPDGCAAREPAERMKRRRAPRIEVHVTDQPGYDGRDGGDGGVPGCWLMLDPISITRIGDLGPATLTERAGSPGSPPQPRRRSTRREYRGGRLAGVANRGRVLPSY